MQTIPELKCGLCETELLPGTSFCRRCGSPIGAGTSVQSSEQPTALLGNAHSATTQRLNPRVTRPTAFGSTPTSSSRRSLLIGVGVMCVILGLVAAVALVKQKTHTSDLTSGQIIYPGSRTVLDMTTGDGSRTLHLQTSDPLDKVENWYQNNLKLTKTTRLTSNSYILKNDQATITLVVEDSITNIFVKKAP